MQRISVAFSSTLVFFLFTLPPLCNSGVPHSRDSPKNSVTESNLSGLYSTSDKVYILNKQNFKDSVIEKNYACLIEFYNSYCGHCKRFAPVYKELAESVSAWSDVVKIMAMDCAVEENNDICREYEVMAYPTLRYFGLNYRSSEGHYGTAFDHRDPDDIRKHLAQLVMNETSKDAQWPNFLEVTPKEAKNLFKSVPDNVKFVILVLISSTPDNSSAIGAQTILNFIGYTDLLIRRVTDPLVAEQFSLSFNNSLAAVDRNANVELLPHSAKTPKDYKEAISTFVLLKKFTTEKSVDKPTTPNPKTAEKDKQKQKVLNEVKRNKHLVYQADLEQAIRQIITTEIYRTNEISGDSLQALQRLIIVLQRYNPLGPNGVGLFNALVPYVTQNVETIIATDLKDRVQQLSADLGPIYTSSQYVGCLGSKDTYRGFTCSLWKLFHFLTVQASNTDHSQDPLEVLTAMHGFVKHFFGCTDCSNHFQEMAKQRDIWKTATKDDAVLWLWEAHNVVNGRLAGDITEDPGFPKTQFPSLDSCRDCRVNVSNSKSSPISWNRVATLSFLKNIYNPNYISRFGLDTPAIIQDQLGFEKVRRKRMIGDVFSDMDMRVAMLLYGFCIVMMIVAFKLFAFKGYRKKAYAHEFLGKA